MPDYFSGPLLEPDTRPWHCVVCSKTLGTVYIGQDADAAQAVMKDCMSYANAATRGEAERLAAIAAGQMRTDDTRSKSSCGI